jgi:hypothetical protein
VLTAGTRLGSYDILAPLGAGAGSCTVIAQQPGNSNVNPAPSVTQVLTIAQVE